MSLVLLYTGPNYKCLIWRTGNLQCLHMVSGSDIPLVLMLVSTRDRKSSHPEAKPFENRGHSPSEPCCAFSDSSLKARCSEHNILAATHCSGFFKWSCFAKYLLTRSSFALWFPSLSCAKKPPDSFTMLNFQWLNTKNNTKFTFIQFLPQSSPNLQWSKQELERPIYYLLNFLDNW